MEPVQRQAVQSLLGKGLLDALAYASGTARASESGRELFSQSFAQLLTGQERNIANFLAHSFAKIGAENISELHRSTGLRRIN